MIAHCTYCSSSKNPDPSNLPAADRYRSGRIDSVGKSAEKAGVPFLILSGKFGLLSSADPIPFYDHLLQASEVRALGEKVAAQLAAAGVTELVFFTRPVSSDAGIRPYRETMVRACGLAGVGFEERLI